MISRRSYLVDFIFLSSLILLIVNDHYLKWTYANWLTGKLSDIAGLVLLPILILKLFSRLKTINAIRGLLLIFIFNLAWNILAEIPKKKLNFFSNLE